MLQQDQLILHVLTHHGPDNVRLSCKLFDLVCVIQGSNTSPDVVFGLEPAGLLSRSHQHRDIELLVEDVRGQDAAEERTAQVAYP